MSKLGDLQGREMRESWTGGVYYWLCLCRGGRMMEIRNISTRRLVTRGR